MPEVCEAGGCAEPRDEVDPEEGGAGESDEEAPPEREVDDVDLLLLHLVVLFLKKKKADFKFLGLRPSSHRRL